MVDHIRTLLLNPDDVQGYVRVTDTASDSTLKFFGLVGACTDETIVDLILPLAMAPDLVDYRKCFDSRISPRITETSVYRQQYEICCDDDTTCAAISVPGLMSRVLGKEGWWTTSNVFSAGKGMDDSFLMSLRQTALGRDSALALGSVLIACAYRRLILQNSGEA